MKDRKSAQAQKMLRYISIPIAFLAIFILNKQQKLEQAKNEPLRSEMPQLDPHQEESHTAKAGGASAEPLTLAWSQVPGETTTMVMTSPKPVYTALLLRKPDEAYEVRRSLIFIGEEGEQRFSLGQAAYEGVYCAFSASSPATLQAHLATLQKAPPTVVCAEKLDLKTPAPDVQ